MIDIKPGSYPNQINLGSNGVMPVAIFDSATFDVHQINPTSTTLTLATLTTTTASIWIGLKNSDDVGIEFDLRAEIYKNNTSSLIGSGELASVAGGSSGFNNANLYSIPVSISTSATFSPGDNISVNLLVRNACLGSGKNSGTSRFWYGDVSANSNTTPIISNSLSYFFDGTNKFLVATGTGTDQVALSTDNADIGNTFRYDSTSNQYIFNLNTASISTGTWQLKIVLNDGMNYTINLSIKN